MVTSDIEVPALGKAVETIRKVLRLVGALLLAAGAVVGVWSAPEMNDGLRFALTSITVALLLLFFARQPRAAMSRAAHPVGSLSDVLVSLGEQLRRAHEAERPHGTIVFSSAEVELSVTTETTHDGSVSFKVLEGGTKRQNGETSILRLQVSPTSWGYEVGQ